MTSQMEVLDTALGNAPVEQVVFRGERLDIKPLTIGQVGEFARLVKPVVEQLLAQEADPDESDIIDMLIDAIAHHTETAIEAAALATRKPVDWISEGDPAEFLELAQAIFRINRRFFLERLKPVLAGLRPGAFAGIGQTRSSSSSSTGTP